MTTTNTPDLTSSAWLGDLADELTAEQVQEFTEYRAGWYLGASPLHGDLDGCTRGALRLASNEVAHSRLEKRTAGRPSPEWSTRTEAWQIFFDDDRGHRHHDMGASAMVTATGGPWFPDDERETVDVNGSARETEEGDFTFFVSVSTGNELRNLTTDEARRLAASLVEVADKVDSVATRQ